MSNEELSQRVAEEARRYPGQEQAFIKYVQENNEMLEQFRGPIFEDKVVDFIMAVAEVTNLTLSKNDMQERLEQ